MLRFFKKNANSLIVGSAVLTNMLASNYWIWTSTGMGTEGENTAGKNIWLIAVTALGMSLGAMGGHGLDLVKNHTAGHEGFSTFFQKNKNKIAGGFLGLAYAFIYDYWVFTPTKMAGTEIPEPVKKMLYMLAKLVADGAIGAEIGNLLDHMGQMGNAEFDEVYHNFDVFERSQGIRPT